MILNKEDKGVPVTIYILSFNVIIFNSAQYKFLRIMLFRLCFSLPDPTTLLNKISLIIISYIIFKCPKISRQFNEIIFEGFNIF